MTTTELSAPCSPDVPGTQDSWLVRLAKRRSTPLVVAMIGICIEWLAATWDIAWHYELGRDRFLTPPHALMVAGGVILGFGPAVVFAVAGRLQLSFAKLGFPGVGLASTAAALQGLTLVVDNWWHNTFGIDVTLWSPPHIALILLWWLAVIGLMADYAADPQARPRILAAWIGLLLATTTIILSEFDFGGPHFRILWSAPILGALTLGALTLARGASGLRWAATLAAAVAVGARAVPVLINLGLHREAPGWPVGILAAGLVVDVVHYRGERRSPALVAALATAAGWGAMFAVEAPWLHATARTWWTGPLLGSAFVAGLGGAGLGLVIGSGLGDRLAHRSGTRRGVLAFSFAIVAAIVIAVPLMNPARSLPRVTTATVVMAGSRVTVSIPKTGQRDWVSMFASSAGGRSTEWQGALTADPGSPGRFIGHRPARLDILMVWLQHGDSSWTGRVLDLHQDATRQVTLVRSGARPPHPSPGWLMPTAYVVVAALLVACGEGTRRVLNTAAM